MNADRIIGLVADRAELQALQATGDYGALADAINGMGLTSTVPTLRGEGAILEALGPVAGGELLDQMEALAVTNSAVKWALRILARAELDFGSPATRAMLDTLLPPEAAAVLKAVAEQPDQTTHLEVMQALGA